MARLFVCSTARAGDRVPRIVVGLVSARPIDLAVGEAVKTMADRGTPPFEDCDRTLRLAEEVGIGTRDRRRLEVLGTSIQDARFDVAAIRRKRCEA